MLHWVMIAAIIRANFIISPDSCIDLMESWDMLVMKPWSMSMFSSPGPPMVVLLVEMGLTPSCYRLVISSWDAIHTWDTPYHALRCTAQWAGETLGHGCDMDLPDEVFTVDTVASKVVLLLLFGLLKNTFLNSSIERLAWDQRFQSWEMLID